MTEEPFREDPFLAGRRSDSTENREEKYSTTQPQCKTCWMRENPEKNPVTVPASLRIHERCVNCGTWNWDGIYIQVELGDVPYPSILKKLGRERF